MTELDDAFISRGGCSDCRENITKVQVEDGEHVTAQCDTCGLLVRVSCRQDFLPGGGKLQPLLTFEVVAGT